MQDVVIPWEPPVRSPLVEEVSTGDPDFDLLNNIAGVLVGSKGLFTGLGKGLGAILLPVGLIGLLKLIG
jgi:hypothetical protein